MTDSEAATPKTMAAALREQLRERWNVDASHSECLEVVAAQHGLANWNILAARQGHGVAEQTTTTGSGVPWGAVNSTIPILRIFSVQAALQFYVEFLGFTLDFGGPAGGEGTAYYGQLSRAMTTLQVTEVAYDPGPGATVFIWMDGVEGLRQELNARREEVRVWGPAVWVPELEEAPWGARVLTIADPFANHLRFNEPLDPAERAALPRWPTTSSA